uniref:Uncharacterized protein n=1 Tax=Picea glauca TaxID=3330 RepID=A0A101LVL3_PICGL|nr:hypothetical protein ABT39_MTgene1970 [Picea glauca]
MQRVLSPMGIEGKSCFPFLLLQHVQRIDPQTRIFSVQSGHLYLQVKGRGTSLLRCGFSYIEPMFVEYLRNVVINGVLNSLFSLSKSLTLQHLR